jgi:hypothetical protein
VVTLKGNCAGIRQYVQEKFLIFCFGFEHSPSHASQSKVTDCTKFCVASEEFSNSEMSGF